MSLTLYTYPGNYRAWKIQVAAAYNGLTLDVQDSNELKDTLFNKPPVLVTPQGHVFESNAIAAYIAGLRGDTNLHGGNLFQSAQVQQWVDFSANELEPARAVWLLPVRGVLEFNGKAYAQAKTDLKDALNVLNTHLVSNTFLVGNQVTLADITVACALVELFQTVLDPNFRKGFPAVLRWFNTCVNQKEFLAVLGEVNMCKKETMAPKPQKQSQDNKKASKKEETKAAAPAPAPKKKGNPLDALPKSSMSLDATKKLFFSKKGSDDLARGYDNFFAEFWPTFDAEGWSFWSGSYDYNDDNKEFWKTQNAVNFYLQRMDPCRKYVFGVLNILGEHDDASYFEMNGCFLVRGTKEIPFELKDVPDSDYYKFVKLPTATDNDKQVIQSYFEGLGKNAPPSNPKDKRKGLKVLERRFFK